MPVTATDQDGSQVAATYSVGAPVVGSALQSTTARVCSTLLGQLGETIDRAVGVPFIVTSSLTSSLPATYNIVVATNSFARVRSDGMRLDTVSALNTPYLVVEDQQCVRSDESRGAAYDNARPGAQHTAEFWIVFENAITPADPTGAGVRADQTGMLIYVTAGLEGSDGWYEQLSGGGQATLCEGNSGRLIAMPAAITPASIGCTGA